MAGLLRVSGVALLDGDGNEVAGVGEDARDVLNARRLQLVPQQPCTDRDGELRRARPHRRLVVDDGRVAVVERLDADDRLRFAGAARAAGVVARPLPERSLFLGLLPGGRHLSLDRYLRPGRYGQSGDRAWDDVHGTPAQTAGQVQFALPPRELHVSGRERERVQTVGGNDRRSLPLVPVPLAYLPALLAGAHPQAEQVFLVRLHPVGADVDEVRLRVLVDEHAAGAEVAASVRGVVAGDGQLPDVDVLALEHVLHHGAARHLGRADKVVVRGLQFPGRHPHQFQFRTVQRQTQRDARALPRRLREADDAVALRVALDVVEQEHRRLRYAVGRRLGQRSDLRVPVRALDEPPVIGCLACLDVGTQVVVRDPHLRFGRHGCRPFVRRPCR